jgi:hypothetical protein
MPWQPPERTLADVTQPRRFRKTNLRQSVHRTVDTCPIFVPPVDWDVVTQDAKPMFRCYGPAKRMIGPVVPADVEFPRPVMAYTRRGDRQHTRERTLMILLEHRMEVLGAISPEDLELEGFDWLPGFRWYWKQRYRKLGWRPWDEVNVIRLRRPVEEDWAWCGEYLMTQLFGEWL